MKTGVISSAQSGDNWTATHHLNLNPRVKVTRNTRARLAYVVSIAKPGEDFTEIARFRAGGDAHSYALTVRDRIAEQHPARLVEFTSAH